MVVSHHIGVEKKDFWNTPFQIFHCDESLSFDGVYDSVITHRELLNGKDVTLFPTLVGDGQERQLEFSEILALVHDYGFKVGWHTWTHPDLRGLTEEQIKRECTAPFETDIFAYPYGEFDDRVIKIIRELGYKKAYSTTQGLEGNDFAIPRHYI